MSKGSTEPARFVGNPYIKRKHHARRVSTVKDEEFLELKELYLEGQKHQQDLEEQLERVNRMVVSLAGMVNALLESTIDELEGPNASPPGFTLKDGTHIFNS